MKGLPSEEKKWLQYYDEGSSERANNIPTDKTVWDVLEESLLKHSDVPALDYYKREISRPDFIDSVYTWARSLRAIGIETNEVVPVYGTFFPDICAITCALNAIGATPYFLKLGMSKENCEKETEGARFAVVFDGMWDHVKDVFSDDRFKKVIISTAADSMLSPKKEIVKFANYIDSVKKNSRIPHESKYMWVDEAKKMANYYTGEVKVPFEANRNSFITASSGTTGSLVKGVVATNESSIAQLYQGNNAGINYFVGDKCLTNFPPTASTSLNCLFLLPLYRGMTLLNDPRIGEKVFYKQLIDSKPQVVLTTGSTWELFFNKVAENIQKGKKIDLSCSKMWIMGGDGTNPKKLERWQEIMKRCGSEYPLYSGYGLSELFSVFGVATKKSTEDSMKSNRPVVSVGIAYPGVEFKIVDKNGKELGYNERGELLVKSKTMMKGYYNKEELTNKTIENNWLHTGDLCDVDENGIVYLWGRFNEKVKLANGEEIYLFDVANAIREDDDIDDAYVNEISLPNGDKSFVAHVVFNKNFKGNKNLKYQELNQRISKECPDITIDGYKEYNASFKYNPTTLKTDKLALQSAKEGFIKVTDKEVYQISYKNIKTKKKIK